MSTSRQKQQFSALLWILVALTVGGYAYWDFKNVAKEKKAKEQAKYIFQLDAKLDISDEKQRKQLIQGITKVSYYNEKGPKDRKVFELSRGKNNRWFLTKPIMSPADSKEVDRALADIIQSKNERNVADWGKKESPDKKPKDLSIYDLAKPKHKVSFTYKKKTYSLELGKKDAFGGNYFLHLPLQKRIVTVSSTTFYAAEKKMFDLRLKEMFTQRTKEIKTLTIVRAKSQVSFQKRLTPSENFGHHHHGHGHGHGHGHAKPKSKSLVSWYMTLPKRAWADRNIINSIVSTLKHLRANAFVSEDAKKDAEKYGLKNPYLSVKVTLKDKSQLALNIGKKASDPKNLYIAAGIGGPIAKVDGYVAKDLTRSAFYYREKKIFKFKQQRVKQIIVNAEGKTFRMFRLEGAVEKWKILDPSPVNAKTSKVSAMLKAITTLKTNKFINEHMGSADLIKNGLNPPVRTYTLLGVNKKKVIAVLHIGKTVGNNVYVTDGEKHVLFRVKASHLKDLPKATWQLTGGKPPKRRPVATSKPAPAASTPAKTAVPTKPAALPTSQPASQPAK